MDRGHCDSSKRCRRIGSLPELPLEAGLRGMESSTLRRTIGKFLFGAGPMDNISHRRDAAYTIRGVFNPVILIQILTTRSQTDLMPKHPAAESNVSPASAFIIGAESWYAPNVELRRVVFSYSAW